MYMFQDNFASETKKKIKVLPGFGNASNVLNFISQFALFNKSELLNNRELFVHDVDLPVIWL